MFISKINDYSISQLIGRGDFNDMYLVHSVDKKKYALKLIRVDQDTKDEARKEAEMYVQFQHPNILKARQFFYYSEENFLAIVLEYCSDGSLDNYIGKINQSQKKLIMKQIVEGLIYIHKKRIIHGNIKPENILINYGIPKISSFGFAQVVRSSGASGKSGTYFYQAPEVLFEEKYGQEADIWSLAIVFVELLLGQRIYELIEGKNPPGSIADFPSQKMLEEIKEKELRDVMKKMLMKSPEERLSLEQMRDFLNGKKGGQQKQVETQSEMKKGQTEEKKILAKLHEEMNQLKIKTYKQAEEKNKLIQQLMIMLDKQREEKKLTQQKLQEQQRRLEILQQQKLEQHQKKQQVSAHNTPYRFSSQYKNQDISIANNNTKAIANNNYGSYGLASVDGVVFDKPTSITFNILSFNQYGGLVGVGLGIRNVILKNNYDIPNKYQIGHGCFLLDCHGRSYSHSNKEHNYVVTNFKYKQGDVIKVGTNNGDEFWWRNETTNKQFSMKVNFSPDEWAQICFCVWLIGSGSSIEIAVPAFSASNQRYKW